MSIFTFLRFGTVDSVPFAPRAKLIPIELAAPAIEAGAGVVGNVLNGLFGSSANDKNIAMQRETNRQNYAMFQEQMAFQERMWDKANEYNLPANQVQRLLAAGINPAAVFGNGSVSEAGALTAPSGPMMSAGHVNPLQADTSFVGQAVNAYNEALLAKSQARNLDANSMNTEQRTRFDVDSMSSRLRSLESAAKRDDALGELARLELSFAQDSYYHRLKSLRNDITAQNDAHELTQEKIYNQRLTNGLAEVQLAYAPRMNAAQLNQYYATVNQIKASIGLINANTMLSKQERLTEIKKRISVILDNAGKVLDNNLKRQMQKYVVGQAIEDYTQKFNENRFYQVGPVRVERHYRFGPYGYTPENVDKSY